MNIFLNRYKIVASEALAAVGCVCQSKDLQNKNVLVTDSHMSYVSREIYTRQHYCTVFTTFCCN